MGNGFSSPNHTGAIAIPETVYKTEVETLGVILADDTIAIEPSNESDENLKPQLDAFYDSSDIAPSIRPASASTHGPEKLPGLVPDFNGDKNFERSELLRPMSSGCTPPYSLPSLFHSLATSPYEYF